MAESKLEPAGAEQSQSSVILNGLEEEGDMYFLNKIAGCSKVPCGLVYEKLCFKEGKEITMSTRLLPVHLAQVQVVGSIIGTHIARVKIDQLYRNLTKEPVTVSYIAYYDSHLGEMFSFKTEEFVYNEISKTNEVVKHEHQIYVGKMKSVDQVEPAAKRRRKSSLSQQSILNQENNPNCLKIKLGVLQPNKQIRIKIAFITELVRELGNGSICFTLHNTFVPRFKLNKSSLNNKHFLANDTFKNITEDVHVGIYTVISLQGDIKFFNSRYSNDLQITHYLGSNNSLNNYAAKMSTMKSSQDVEDIVIKFAYNPFETVYIYREKYGGNYSHLVEFQLANMMTKKSDYEIIFFLDLSSSMAGLQFVLAKHVIMRLISVILPSLVNQRKDWGDCYFNICGFGNKIFKFKPSSVLAGNIVNIDQAVTFINDCSPEFGEKDFLEALNVMRESVVNERLKTMIIITDGWMVKNFDSIQELVRAQVNTRFHMIGVGANISKYGITSIANGGRGQALFYKSNFQDIGSNLLNLIELSLSCEKFGTSSDASWLMESSVVGQRLEGIKNYAQMKEFPSTRSFGGYMRSYDITKSQSQIMKFVYNTKDLSSGASKRYEIDTDPEMDFNKIKVISKYCKLLQMRELEVDLEKYEYFQERNSATRDAAIEIRKQIVEISIAEGFPSPLTVMKPHLQFEDKSTGKFTFFEKENTWKIQSCQSLPCPKFDNPNKDKSKIDWNINPGNQLVFKNDSENDDERQLVNFKEQNLAEIEVEKETRTDENITREELPEIKIKEEDLDVNVAQSVEKNEARKELEEINKIDEPEVKKVKNEPLSQSECETGESKSKGIKGNGLNLLIAMQIGDGSFDCNDEFCDVFGSTREEVLKARKGNWKATGWVTVLASTYATMSALDAKAKAKTAGLREKASRWIQKNISAEKVHPIEEAAKDFIYEKLH